MTEARASSRGADSSGRQETTLRSTIDTESLAEARRLIGYDYRAARSTIEVSADNTRDYANYIGSNNRMYLDPAYARSSRWGRPLAPPTIVGTSIIAPGLRGVQWIYGGARWRFHRLFGPGDVLAQTGRLVDAEAKSGRAASSMIMQKGVTSCVNADGETVVETEVYTMRIPRKRASSGGLNYAKRETTWTVGELDGFAERLLAQRRLGRGPEIRYWDDVDVGESVDEVLCGPLRLSDIALTRGTVVYGIIGGGRDENGGYSYMLDHYRRHPAHSYENPETGVTEHPHRGHWEQYMADEVGMPGIYDIGYQRLGWLCRVITDWMGDDGRLRALEGWLRRPNVVGDVTYVSGVVTEKRLADGVGTVVCALSGKNQHGEETVRGSAEVELLARGTDTEQLP
ncbi:MAG TPA: MaoC family dehydratase N-terminal domain-containing protein [Nocardioides sp.]|jgi:acyl dehydratase|uniref:FAS1-like dehydratase domain-containing protein n=1 Tax=Nocardioides sp. TaxID=35761 RepID=UPI002E2F4353|nr:MaoC family dehydratase N-terminal domain-containing protein [Nocardioides sp.]HEX3930518.1 MaoC family dehydratase N-terminal domain-containing protein [Nocardioides sp.]